LHTPKPSGVILNERGPERFRGTEDGNPLRELFGAGSGVESEVSAFQNLAAAARTFAQKENRSASSGFYLDCIPSDYGKGITTGVPRSYVRPEVTEQLNVTRSGAITTSPLATSDIS
jgi:hypothetical protein